MLESQILTPLGKMMPLNRRNSLMITPRIQGNSFKLKDNPERSSDFIRERATTIPKGSRVKQLEAGSTQTSKVVGDDIVSSIWQHIAVHKRTGKS